MRSIMSSSNMIRTRRVISAFTLLKWLFEAFSAFDTMSSYLAILINLRHKLHGRLYIAP